MRTQQPEFTDLARTRADEADDSEEERIWSNRADALDSGRVECDECFRMVDVVEHHTDPNSAWTLLVGEHQTTPDIECNGSYEEPTWVAELRVHGA